MEVVNDETSSMIPVSQLPKIQDPIICSSLKLSEYITRYDGYTKVQRLIFIAEKCSNLQEEAYRLLLEELKRGTNTTLYVKIFELVGPALGYGSDFDREWYESIERRESIKLERLEAELMAAKTTMVKESIRLSFNDIGDLHYERGNLGEAMKSYLRTRDYCTIPKHNLELYVRVVSVSMDSAQFGNVNSYITKAENTAGDVTISAKIKASAALVLLIEGQYKGAARKFLEVGRDLAGSFSSIIAAEDIAIYGTLCALATLDRAEIRKGALENTVFKSFLELVPDVKHILHSFFAGKYGECLSYFKTFQSELLLDLHLAKHVAPLIAQITERMILLYFSPYSSVDMNRMALALNMDIVTLEKSIASLISNNKISARIDSQSKTLHRREYDVRFDTMEKIERLSSKHLREVKRGILRLSVMQHGFQVPSRESAASSRGGGGQSSGQQPSLVLSSSSGGGREKDLRAIELQMNEKMNVPLGNEESDISSDDKMNVESGDLEPFYIGSSSTSAAASGQMDTSHSLIEDQGDGEGEDDNENED